jgi:hypothetical protein
MNSILKWLHKNESIVHASVMFVAFYGIPAIGLAFFHPSLVTPLMHSAVVGLILMLLLFVSYKAATVATEAIKSAVTHAALEQIREYSISNNLNMTTSDHVVDYTSPNTLVVENISGEMKEAVTALKAAVESAPKPDVTVQSPSKKRRGRQPKPAKKGG